MKKFLALVLVVVMAMSMVACGSKDAVTQPDPQPNPVEDNKEPAKQADTDLFLPADFSDAESTAVTSVKNMSVLVNKADLESGLDIMSWTFGMIGAAAEGNEEELDKLAATPMVAYAEDSIYIIKATEYMAFAGITDETVDLSGLTSEKLSEFINEQNAAVSGADDTDTAEEDSNIVANGTSASDYGAEIILLDTGSLNAGEMDDSLWGDPDGIGDGDEEEESPLADIPMNPNYNQSTGNQATSSGNESTSKPSDGTTNKNDTAVISKPADESNPVDIGGDTDTEVTDTESGDIITVGNIVAQNDEKVIFEISMDTASMTFDAENEEVHSYKGYGAIITKDGKTAYAVMLCDQTAGVSIDNAMQFVKSLNIDLSIPGATAEEIDKLNGLDMWAGTDDETGSEDVAG